MSSALMAPGRAKKNFSALAFVAENAGIIEDVWAVLGRSWTNLAFELGWAVEAIPAGEHGKLKIELTDEQRYQLVPLLGKMSFFRGLDINAGSYDELHITGAKFGAMVARVRLVRKRLEKGVASARFKVNIGKWVAFCGQRPRTNWQDGTVEEIYASLSDKVKQHPWVIAQMELQRALDEEIDAAKDFIESTAGYSADLLEYPWRGAFATEHELGILAFIVGYDGDVEVGDPVASHEDLPKLPGVPKHTVASCTLTLPPLNPAEDASRTPVLVLNAPAVIRKMGAPRPTTKSGAEYWLKFYTPAKGAKIVVVSGKTHWYRVIGSFEDLVHDYHPDVLISGMSESAVDPLPVVNNALAELVWLMRRGYDEMIINLQGNPMEARR